MSKRVLIMLGIGLLLIVGSLFLMKYEINEAYKNPTEPEDEDIEPEPELKPAANETGTETAV